MPLSAVASLALMLSACGGGGLVADDNNEVITLTVASAVVDETDAAHVRDWFMTEVESRAAGRIAFDKLPVDALCAGPEVPSCVQDGRADMGIGIPDYTPQLFPDASIVGLPFMKGGNFAVTAALESLHQEHEGVQALYKKNKLVHLSTWPVGRLLIGTKEPISEVADLKGVRVRLTGAGIQTAVKAGGGSIVALPIAETYEGLDRGVIDGGGFAMDAAVNYKMVEVLPHWTDAGTGEYSTFAMWMNQSTFDGLPADLQTVVKEVASEIASKGVVTDVYSKGGIDLCKGFTDTANVQTMTRWDEKTSQKWADLLGDTPRTDWLASVEKNGLTDAQTFLDQYIEGLAKHADADVSDPVSDCIDTFAAQK